MPGVRTDRAGLCCDSQERLFKELLATGSIGEPGVTSKERARRGKNSSFGKNRLGARQLCRFRDASAMRRFGRAGREDPKTEGKNRISPSHPTLGTFLALSRETTMQDLTTHRKGGNHATGGVAARFEVVHKGAGNRNCKSNSKEGVKMRLSKMKMITGCCVLLLAGLLVSPAISYSLDIEIDISPNVLNIQSEGTVVTVHTDIAYSRVYAYSVYLNGLLIQSWKADDRGNFVAKFSMDEVKALDGLDMNAYNLFTMAGVTTEGEPFGGEQEIKVIQVIPAGR
jgi:hypothetical protein